MSDPAFAAHLWRVGLWGAASVLAGLVARRRPGPCWRQFAVQCILWGAVNVGLALAGSRGTPPSAAFLWANVGLDVGYVAVAVTLVLVGRRFTSLALQGAGWAIAPQGLFLLVADLVYLADRAWA